MHIFQLKELKRKCTGGKYETIYNGRCWQNTVQSKTKMEDDVDEISVRRDFILRAVDRVNSQGYMGRIWTTPNSSSDEDIVIETNHPRWEFSDFEFKCSIGSGAFGQVFKAVEKKTGCPVALKHITKPHDRYERHMVENEITKHSTIHHPNIVQFYGYFYDTVAIYTILELSTHGSLYDVMCLNGSETEPQPFPENVAKKYIQQTAFALDYMHEVQLAHLDIKPDNILLFDNDVVKLCDFGFTTDFSKLSGLTIRGTAEYIAPEVADGKSFDEKVDIWALGILTFELCHGKTPFYSPEANHRKWEKTIQRKISGGNYNMPDHFSVQLIYFLKKIMRTAPWDRPSFSEILNYSWISMRN